MEKDINSRIVDQAKKMGASVAGIANVDALKKSPSHFVFGKLERYKGVGTKASGKVKCGEVYWPEFARAAVVIGVEHPAGEPELDWWQEGLPGGTTGNRLLREINSLRRPSRDSGRVAPWSRRARGAARPCRCAPAR